MRKLCAPTLAVVLSSVASAMTITSPTTSFNVVPFPHPMDYVSDQQTGQSDADIVGTSANPGFYSQYDPTNNNIYYRVRLGSTLTTKGAPSYSGLFWVAIDANHDGKLDLFIGVNNQGSNKSIEFHAAGTGANNSPSTTTIANVAPQYVIVETSSNMNYQQVSSTLQPGITSLDLNGDGKTDAFLTIAVPFLGANGSATIQGALMGLAGISISASSTMQYVTATSTQVNSLNQDIGSLDNKNYVSTSTWAQLGAITPLLTANGQAYASSPEPSSAVLAGSCVLAIFLKRRHARSKRG